MSRVVPGFLGIFGPGPLVVMFCRTSQNVLSCPRTSWDFCFGIVRKVHGSPGHLCLVSINEVYYLFFLLGPLYLPPHVLEFNPFTSHTVEFLHNGLNYPQLLHNALLTTSLEQSQRYSLEKGFHDET